MKALFSFLSVSVGFFLLSACTLTVKTDLQRDAEPEAEQEEAVIEDSADAEVQAIEEDEENAAADEAVDEAPAGEEVPADEDVVEDVAEPSADTGAHVDADAAVEVQGTVEE